MLEVLLELAGMVALELRHLFRALQQLMQLVVAAAVELLEELEAHRLGAMAVRQMQAVQMLLLQIPEAVVAVEVAALLAVEPLAAMEVPAS